MKTDELREKYLEFFETKGCVRRPSDVLVPRWDPSVLFTPAGMNQFKDHFLGRCKLDFTRATTCQKCLRTGDIDNVGRTAYHHTFFEMLGNFSFGDYFKRDAINWAWEFCTDKKWLGMDPERLTATIYLDDDEAAEIWLNDIKLPPKKLERIGEDENFWPASAPSLGPDGVCGPCSEIYYHTDTGEVEIWNLVFTQFNRVGDPPDNLRPLPSKNIDTGMGLERAAAVMQGVETNYHIDILRPLVEAAGDVCGTKYDPESREGRRLRRIADHVRACTFAIHENVYPANKEEGYVIRKLIRRATLDAYQLGVEQPVLHKLVGAVVDAMAAPYPELAETATRVAQGIENEEGSFFDTIGRGMPRAEKLIEEARSRGAKKVPGKPAFKLLETYGFPPELTEAMALEAELAFDWDGYRQAQRDHEVVSGPTEPRELFKSGPLDELKPTLPEIEFVGYETETCNDAKVVGLIDDDRTCYEFQEIDNERKLIVVLDKTPFYGEMGGQVGDVGEISCGTGRFEVVDTKMADGVTLHVGFLREGKIGYKDTVTATVDHVRRQAIRRAHSATHLLHYALRNSLGDQTQQKGSKVEPDEFRFDFNHNGALSAEQLAEIEGEVNARAIEGVPITWTNMPIEEARQSGATMLFGEKYPDVVRVVSAGDFSKELCGGTHLDNSGLIGPCKIISEESIAKGIRRITAHTGAMALETVRRNEDALAKAAGALKIPAEQVGDRVEALVKEVRKLKKQATAGAKASGPSVESLLAEATEVAGTKIVVADVPGAGPNDLRQLIDQLRRKAAPVAVMLGNGDKEENKVLLIGGLSRDLVERGLDAVAWVRQTAKIVGGGGGGRPDMAQAGGKLPAKLPEALKAARTAIETMLADV